MCRISSASSVAVATQFRCAKLCSMWWSASVILHARMGSVSYGSWPCGSEWWMGPRHIVSTVRYFGNGHSNQLLCLRSTSADFKSACKESIGRFVPIYSCGRLFSQIFMMRHAFQTTCQPWSSTYCFGSRFLRKNPEEYRLTVKWYDRLFTILGHTTVSSTTVTR